MISTLGLILLINCTGLDDQALPPEAAAQVTFKSFDIDPSRNYFIARLENNSPYVVSSCRIDLAIYPESPLPSHELILSEESPDISRSVSKALITESFLIRDPLKPGYSNEVYYELKIDQLRGTAIYVKKLSDLKGRLADDQID